jgi:hypothetical protein
MKLRQKDRGAGMAKRREGREPCIAIYSLYGPNDRLASKAVVAIAREGTDDIIALPRWMTGRMDVRQDKKIQGQIVAFLKNYNIRQVVTTGTIIGCPPEEGQDYPVGEACPFCPFWEGRNRWAGKLKDE